MEATDGDSSDDDGGGGSSGEWRMPEVDGGWETNGSGKGNGEEKAEGLRGVVGERR